MKLISRTTLLTFLLVGSLFNVPSSAIASPEAPEVPENVLELTVDANEDGITVVVVETFFPFYPTVDFTFDSVNYQPIPLISGPFIGGAWRDTYRLSTPLPCGQSGTVNVYYQGVLVATTGFTVNCSLLGSIRGTAFRDGARFGGAWYKITDGGNWYVCGTVGSDGTYGVPVRPGVYYVIPLNLQGLRASGIMRVVVEGGRASLNNDIRYESDPTATHESCDLYNPPRPIPSELRR